MSSGLSIRVRGRRGDFELSAELEAPATGVSVVFGRSGSGKTTLLRAVAGLERLDGRIVLADRVLQDDRAGVFVPPERRGVGYVFQDALLFPHLSVRDNLEYGARRAPRDKGRDFDAVVQGLGLASLLRRSPAALSGGERQRVAIARALLSRPALLSMDEPISALDLEARATLLSLLEALHSELAVPLLYVTHSIDEASRLADRVVWLDRGRVRAQGAPGDVFARLDFGLALDDEAGALVAATVRSHDERFALTELDSDFGPVVVAGLRAAVGGSVRLRVRARDVSIALEREDRSSIVNVFPVEVAELTDASASEVMVRLVSRRQPANALLARVLRRSAEELELRPGAQVFARVKGVSLR